MGTRNEGCDRGTDESPSPCDGGSAGEPVAASEGSLALQIAPAPLTREQRRSRRRHEVRGKSISTRRLSRHELALGAILYPETDYWKPRTRADCADVPRPCPYVSCKYNLYLDVSARTGSIKLNFPDLEVEQLPESCVLDVADRGGATLEDVGGIMNLTRERVRQLERSGMARIVAEADTLALREFIDERPSAKGPKAPLTAEDFDKDSDAADEADGDSEDALDHADSLDADCFQAD